jgi:hypothetical protein
MAWNRPKKSVLRSTLLSINKQLVKIWLYGKHFVELLQLQIVGLEWIDANEKYFLNWLWFLPWLDKSICRISKELWIRFCKFEFFQNLLYIDDIITCII